MQIKTTNRPSSSPISFESLRKKITDYWKWAALRWMKFLAAGCATLSCFAVYVATTDKIVVGPFSVPKEYEERGYTSEAISNAVVQFIRGNGSTVTLIQSGRSGGIGAASLVEPSDDAGEEGGPMQNIDGKHIVSSFDQPTIGDIRVPLTAFTLESLTELLRTTIGHQPTRIAGEIVFRDEADSVPHGSLDPQRTRVLIRYKIEYPEPSYSILGYHWWSRRMTTLTDTLSAGSAEEAIQMLALVAADGVEERTLVHEQTESRAGRYVARGNTYIGLNDYDRAARMYEQANTLLQRSAHKPGSAHAYLALGVISEREGNYDDAKRFYETAAEIPEHGDDDDAAWAQLYFANLLVKENQFDLAVKEYKLVVAHPPHGAYAFNTAVVQAAALDNLGFMYAWKLKWSLAEDSFREAQALSVKTRESARGCAYGDAEEFACGQVKGDSERQRVKAEALLTINSTNELLALSYYGLGRAMSRQHGDEHSSIKQYYWQAIHANAKHAPTHYQLGKIYREEYRYKEAIEQFQAAIDSDPSFEPAYAAWRDLVEHWQQQPGKKTADRPLSRTLASKYKNWGDGFRRTGDPDNAADRFCIAADLDPTYKGLCTGLSQ